MCRFAIGGNIDGNRTLERLALSGVTAKAPKESRLLRCSRAFTAQPEGGDKGQARKFQDRGGETERAPVSIFPISRRTGPLSYEQPRRQLDESTSRKLAGTAER